jgi:hypothetical protein
VYIALLQRRWKALSNGGLDVIATKIGSCQIQLRTSTQIFRHQIILTDCRNDDQSSSKVLSLSCATLRTLQCCTALAAQSLANDHRSEVVVNGTRRNTNLDVEVLHAAKATKVKPVRWKSGDGLCHPGLSALGAELHVDERFRVDGDAGRERTLSDEQSSRKGRKR